jgi:hypothetical protein
MEDCEKINVGMGGERETNSVGNETRRRIINNGGKKEI